MPKLRVVIVDDVGGGAAVYLTTPSGEAWRVYDCVGARPRRGNVAIPPDAMATHRHFVGRGGHRRTYAFGPKDSRALVPRLLSGQLSAAQPPASG